MKFGKIAGSIHVIHAASAALLVPGWRWRRAPALLALGALPLVAYSQVRSTPAEAARLQLAVKPAPAPTPLGQLVAAAERDNSEIQMARHAWLADRQGAAQATSLPDPQAQVQSFSVGSPVPFAGYTNSDFAYLGVGVSQELPYPGKLRLRGEIAGREAALGAADVTATERRIAAALKTAYFHLAYARQSLDTLADEQSLLRQIEQVAEARYRAGQGNEQDVLQAQLNLTEILREIEGSQQLRDSLEAQLKQILNRPPQSADIVPAPLRPSPLPYSYEQLQALALAQQRNPTLAARQTAVEAAQLQARLARKDFEPDFNVSYMWERTDPQRFRAYYMLTVGMTLPFLHPGRRHAALTQASEQRAAAQQQYQTAVRQTEFDLHDAYLKAASDARLLPIYRQGLIPQATASFAAGLAAYRVGRQDFETLLAAFRNLLNLNLEYQQTVADHETALARIEQIAGVPLN